MAKLALAPTVAAAASGAAHPISQMVNQSIGSRDFSGAGTESTEIAAAVTGSYHVVCGGRVGSNGAEVVTVLSAATVLETIHFVVADAKTFQRYTACAVGEALNLKLTTGATVQGRIYWATVTAGQTLHIPPGL